MRRGTDIFAPRMSFAYFSAVRPSRNSLRRSWSSLVGDCQPLREHLSPLSQVIVRPFSRHGRVFPARPLSPGPGKGNASVGALHTDVRRPRSATLRPPAGCASRRRTRLERAVHPRRAVVPEHGTTRAALPDLLNHLGRVPLPDRLPGPVRVAEQCLRQRWGPSGCTGRCSPGPARGRDRLRGTRDSDRRSGCLRPRAR